MRSLNCRLLGIVLVAIFHVFTCFSVAGLTEDKQQPVYISSDRAQSDSKKNVTVYEGSVELTQGTLKILADKLIIYNDDKDIDKIVAIGQPAHYRQQPSTQQGDIIAQANRIDVELEKERIFLQGNASITQDGAILNGETIDYDIRAAVMKAESDKRIQVIIPPNINQ